MGLYINSNIPSINAQRNLNKTGVTLSKTFNRLASGLRINSAQDDAAGLGIAARLSSQIRGINQGMRNANDVISLTQVAEGALDESTNALQRIRELSVQSANDTYTSGDRTSMQKEVDQLLSEITRISSDTEFNSQKLLQGSFSGGKTFQVGAYSGQSVVISITSAAASMLGVSGMLISTQAKANSALTGIDAAINSIADIRANLGAMQNRFESIISNMGNVVENLSAARSRIMDADIATETATLTRASILQQAGTAILAQANQQPQLALQLMS